MKRILVSFVVAVFVAAALILSGGSALYAKSKEAACYGDCFKAMKNCMGKAGQSKDKQQECSTKEDNCKRRCDQTGGAASK